MMDLHQRPLVPIETSNIFIERQVQHVMSRIEIERTSLAAGPRIYHLSFTRNRMTRNQIGAPAA
jgi:hypothetical protein